VTTRGQADGDEDYGLGWWLSRGDPALFEANGRGGQRITVVPDLNLVVVMTGGGFEPGDIGRFILRALRSDTALPDDRAGQERLAQSLRLIAEPPPATEPRSSVTSRRISGRVYDAEENPLGIASLSLAFGEPESAMLQLRLDSGEELTQRLGLDGRY